MTDKKFTDEEIIKALECISGKVIYCRNCKYSLRFPMSNCTRQCAKDALDLINRYENKIEDLEIRLKHFAEFLAEAEKKNEALISAQETLQKHIESKNSVIERLRHANKCAIEALSAECGILLERKDAEIERLEAENKALHRLLDAKGEQQ